MSALHLHATAALAAKLGGFTEPADEPRQPPLILDAWYANLIRRRKPRVMLVNPGTLAVATLPLAPAKSLLTRVPSAVTAMLLERGVPGDFITAHVGRLNGGGAVVRTASRRMVGILNERIRYADYWDAETDEQWRELDLRLSDHLVLNCVGPRHGDDRLALAIETWRRTGTATVPGPD